MLNPAQCSLWSSYTRLGTCDNVLLTSPIAPRTVLRTCGLGSDWGFVMVGRMLAGFDGTETVAVCGGSMAFQHQPSHTEAGNAVQAKANSGCEVQARK